MAIFDQLTHRPRATGIACAIAAVSCGLVYLALADAPLTYMLVNAGALVAGLALLALWRFAGEHDRGLPGVVVLAMASVLLATALLGEPVDGAARWLRLGGFFVQPSLILLPMMILGFARRRDRLGAAGMIVAAAALALQPDRAMAAMLAAGLGLIAIMRPSWLVIAAFAASLVGSGVTIARADTLPAVPFVEQVLYSSFEVHILAGTAALAGSLLLLIPALLGRGGHADRRAACFVFGMVWLSAILAAALGNYPTPVVGYGASAIIGYVLSLAMLPARAGVASARHQESATVSEDQASGEPRIGAGLPA